MCKISTTEFKNNFGKYIEMGQKEEVLITKRGIVILRLIPERFSLYEEAKTFLNLLPKEATIGVDPNERG